MSEQDVQLIIDRVSKSVNESLDKKFDDYARTLNANVHNSVDKRFAKLQKELTDQLPIMHAVTSTPESEPSWFVKFKQSVTEQYDGLSKKVETMFIAHPPTVEVPTVENIVPVKKLEKAKNWIVRMWNWVTDNIVNPVKKFVSRHAFLCYLSSVYVSGLALIYVGYSLPAVLIVDALVVAMSIQMMRRSIEEYNLRSVSGASNGKSGEADMYPLRAKAAIQIIISGIIGFISGVELLVYGVIPAVSTGISAVITGVKSAWVSIAGKAVEDAATANVGALVAA